MAGQSKAMEVPFTANPQPKVQWTYNGSKLPDAKRFKEETIANMTCVRMSKVKRGDAGDYKVKLENKHGDNNFTVKVIVLGKLVYFILKC